MPTTDQSARVRTPGRLCINPTDLTLAFPHGGTSLGLVKDIVLVCNKTTIPMPEEGLGMKIVDKLVMCEEWGLTAVLRSVDQGVISNFFAASKLGASTGETGIVSPGSTVSPTKVLPGTWLGSQSVKLLFSPLDPEQWFVYMPRALPEAAARAEMRKTISEDDGIPVAFTAVPPDGSTESLQWRPKEDIAL